jgi:hypothetical protein
MFLTNSDSSAAERTTSIRELCKINRDAVTNAADRPPVKDEKDGWIVKKGGGHYMAQESDEEKTSAPSVSPDEVEHGPDPFSTCAYDDFLEFEYPKKQQIKRLSGERRSLDSKPSSISHSHEEDDDFQQKKRRLDTIHVDSSTRMSDFLPSSATPGKPVSNPIYQTEWSSQDGSHGQSPALNAPMHSHLRCVDPNKTWNMITRTTGPTTPLHPSSQCNRPPASPAPSRHQYPPHQSIARSSPQPQLDSPQSSAWSDDLRRSSLPFLSAILSHPRNRKVEANKQRALARLQENRYTTPHYISSLYSLTERRETKKLMILSIN